MIGCGRTGARPGDCPRPSRSSMNDDEELIRAKRDSAARARRLATAIYNHEDVRQRLLEFAAALEAEADAADGLLQNPPSPQVTQIQMQVQQGPPANDDP